VVLDHIWMRWPIARVLFLSIIAHFLAG